MICFAENFPSTGNGSDVFRFGYLYLQAIPYISIEKCIRTAQKSNVSILNVIIQHFQTFVVHWQRSPSTGVYLARQYKSEAKKANMKKKYDENVGMNEEDGDRRRSRL
jgi:hypothetical protein